MKKSLLALAALGMIAGAAQAQTAVTVYGAVDIGIVKVKNQTTSIGRGDNNKLGFKGTEDLGGGLSALFQLEMRYEPDTGTTESAPNRPLFQGQSRVGLKGDFGTIRLGRGLTAAQDAIALSEPWSFDSNRGNLVAFTTANYNGDPLNPGSSQNRFSNAVFYNSPVMGGFQANVSISTKEAQTSGTPVVNPYSLAGTYTNGPFSGVLAYERNALEAKFWNLGVAFEVAPGIKLQGSLAQNKLASGFKTNGITVGGQFKVGNGVILAGYGRNKPDNTAKTDQFSLGYEHNLSKRTFLYADIWDRRAPGVASVYAVDVGIHHNF